MTICSRHRAWSLGNEGVLGGGLLCPDSIRTKSKARETRMEESVENEVLKLNLYLMWESIGPWRRVILHVSRIIK